MDNDTPDHQPSDEAKPVRTPLRQRLKAKFNRAAKSEFAEVLKDTAEDLKTNNKERVAFGVATVVPGGWIAYYAHRHHKFKNKGADDGDAPPAPPKAGPSPRQP